MKDDSFEFGGVKMNDVTHRDCKVEIQALEARLRRAVGIITNLSDELKHAIKSHPETLDSPATRDDLSEAQSFLAEGRRK